LTQQKWWSSTFHRDRRSLLLTRNAVVASIRAHFASRDFVEVDTAAIQVSPGNETHIHAVPVNLHPPGDAVIRRYLHTSPEFAMKKLLAAGETRIFSLAHVFRDREQGPLHACEFTLLEWYRTGDSYREIIADCIDIIRLAARQAGTSLLRHRQTAADPFGPIEMLSVPEAFDRHAGIDLLATCSADASVDRNAFADAARRRGLAVRGDDGWSDIFSRVLVALIEPKLGQEGICVLHGYPRREAALSAVNAQDPRLADRFEIYACGVELANGFRELTDPVEQRRRFEVQMDEKQRIYGERYPIDEDFLEALASMPAASGVALGLDRLIMLATGAPNLRQVVWTPHDV
jgi:elongation factor P--(R)-beta-lysine ligase